jgi:radical SAM protein with 4Fe4S-binding SPASM domain
MIMIEYAYIETTNYCNLQCTFCNRHEVIGALQHMSIPKFIELMEKIKHHPINTAKLMGMGEPFMHPKFNEICRIFKQYFPNAFLIVATNCQYKIRPWFEECLQHIDMLYLSIDGYEDSYETYRPPSKWEKLMQFLEQMKDIPRHGCRIVCNYVVNPGNVSDIQLVHDNIVIPYGLEQFRLNIAQDWSEDRSMPGGYTKEQLEYLQSEWKDCIQGKSEWNYSDCFWVKNGLYVTVEGRVLACCMNTAAKQFGNIFEDSIENIQNGNDFQAVKHGCATNNPTSHCKNCSYKELAPMLKEIGIHNA